MNRIALTFVTAIFASLSVRAGEQFDGQMTLLAKALGGPSAVVENQSELFQLETFRDLWNAAAKNEDNALRYFQDDTQPSNAKFVLSLAMQNLSAQDLAAYVRFCRKAVGLMKAGRLDKKLVFRLIFSNDRIWEADTDEVLNLLKELKTQDLFLERVDFILSNPERGKTRSSEWPLR